MYTEQEKCTMNWADSYTLLYGFIAKRIIENCGLEGEAAVREATRQFGYDRAETTRQKHLSVGAKINMLNLFTLYHDLPGDPRFRRELQEINPQERVFPYSCMPDGRYLERVRTNGHWTNLL